MQLRGFPMHSTEENHHFLTIRVKAFGTNDSKPKRVIHILLIYRVHSGNRQKLNTIPFGHDEDTIPFGHDEYTRRSQRKGRP